MKIEEIRNEPYFKINKFIKESGYTYTVKNVLDGYKDRKNGYYLSYTMDICVKNLKIEIEELLKDVDKRLNIWQIATNNNEKQHPKCVGKECGTWELCNTNETEILNYGCVYYDEEAENKLIDDEIEAGI